MNLFVLSATRTFVALTTNNEINYCCSHRDFESRNFRLNGVWLSSKKKKHWYIRTLLTTLTVPYPLYRQHPLYRF
jgi:hypothetical protein